MKRLIIILFLMMLIGTASADTSVIYPSIDGNCGPYETSGYSFTTLRQLTGGSLGCGNSDPQDSMGTIQAAAGSGEYKQEKLTIMIFNTSGIPAGATISTINFSFVPLDRLTQFSTTPSLVIGGGKPASNTSLAIADYHNNNTIEYTDRVAFSSMSYGVRKNISLTNLTWINKGTGGFSYLFFQLSWMMDNAAPTWAANKYAYIYYNSLAATGSDSDPYIEITYTTGSAPVSSFTIQKPLYTIPKTIQVNDTSTNTPTQWNWSWGDGTWTNGTTQNATHKYTTRGLKSILLVTSNAIGANTTPTASTVRIVGYENYW